MNLAIAVLLAAAVAPSPAPSASPMPTAGSCRDASGRTALLAALNRPTIGYSPCAVLPGESVYELGYANQEGASATATYPQGDLRFGVAPRLELSFLGPAFASGRDAADGTGAYDSGAGVKWQVMDGAAGAAGFDFLYTVPTGAASLSAGRPTATLNFDYSRSLSPAIGFGMTLGAMHGAGLSAWVPSAVLTGALSPRAQLYAEAFGESRISAGGSLFGLDGGIQYLALPSLEVDAELGRTVTALGQSHYFGAGLGIRV